MRHDWLNIVAKISKKFHIHKVVYKACKLLLPIHHPDRMDNPEEYLSSIYPPKKNTCIISSEITPNPQYDVQIIVPVYNVEQYLEECMDSIISQKTRYSYHVVVINDGSTDGSRNLLKHYEQIDFVTIIDQTNQGLSAARNTGLKNIDARYVMFVDSDDRMEQGAIEKLVSKADELGADIVAGNSIHFHDDIIISRSNYVDDFSLNAELSGTGWRCIFRASIWKNIGFPLYVWYEDIVYNLLVYQQPIKRATIHDIVYHYRKNPTGISGGNNQAKRRVETYWVTKQVLNEAKESGFVVYTPYYYKTFLHQCRMNVSRVAILGNRRADYALFEAQRQLRDVYFGDDTTDDYQLKSFEKALREDDFKSYFLQSLFLF